MIIRYVSKMVGYFPLPIFQLHPDPKKFGENPFPLFARDKKLLNGFWRGRVND